MDRIAGAVEAVGAAGRSRRREVPGGDPAAYVKRSLRGADDAGAVRGRVRLAAPAGLIAPRVPARYATVEPDGPDACLVTTVGRWSREFLVWMALLDVELTVLEPPELVSAAGGVAARLAPAPA